MVTAERKKSRILNCIHHDYTVEPPIVDPPRKAQSKSVLCSEVPLYIVVYCLPSVAALQPSVEIPDIAAPSCMFNNMCEMLMITDRVKF